MLIPAALPPVARRLLAGHLHNIARRACHQVTGDGGFDEDSHDSSGNRPVCEQDGGGFAFIEVAAEGLGGAEMAGGMGDAAAVGVVPCDFKYHFAHCDSVAEGGFKGKRLWHLHFHFHHIQVVGKAFLILVNKAAVFGWRSALSLSAGLQFVSGDGQNQPV